MARILKINFDNLEIILKDLKTYENQLKLFREVLKETKEMLSQQEGEAFEELEKSEKLLEKEIEKLEEMVGDQKKLLKSFDRDMRQYLTPTGGMMLVDRDNIMVRVKELSDTLYGFGSINTSWTTESMRQIKTSDPNAPGEKVKVSEEVAQKYKRNKAVLESGLQQMKTAGKKLDELVPPIKKVYQYNVSKFENTDDNYSGKLFDAKLYPKYTSAKEKRKDDAGTGIKNVGVALNTIKEGIIGLVDVKNTIGSFIYLLKDPAGALKGILGKTRREYEKNGATSFLTTLAIAYATQKIFKKTKFKIPSKQKLIKELLEAGEKVSPDDVVWIKKSKNGKITWLEKGNKNAGLKHIIIRHEKDFLKKGIKKNQISGFIKKGIEKGKFMGYQDKKKTGAIYKVKYNGKYQYICITRGKNGFIVSANPSSLDKIRK